MGRSNSAMQYIATTGAGIAIGTGIQLASVHRCSDLAGTITILAGATVILTMSADRQMTWPIPIAIQGPVTMTSSGGLRFLVGFRDV